MKIKIKEVSYFKKLIGLASNLINKSRPETSEGCIFFDLKDGLLSMTVGSSGSHMLRLRTEVDSADEGSFCVLASLLNCFKVIPTEEVLLTVSKDTLNITASSFGTQSKPLHTSASLGKMLTEMPDNVLSYQLQGNSTLALGLKSISSFISKDKAINVRTKKDYTQVLGVGDLGYISYIDYGVSSEEIEFCFDNYYTPYLSQLGDVLSIGVGTEVIEFSSSVGSLFIYNQGYATDEYKNVSQILDMKRLDNPIRVNTKDLRLALQWQSHGSNDLDFIDLSLDKEGKFSVKGVNTLEPSSLPLLSSGNNDNDTFKKVCLNSKALEKSIYCISSDEIVIAQRAIEVEDEDEPITITSFSTHGYRGSETTSLLFEQVM